ncbi:hypothetical protein [Moorena producens]|uniref:hypothetical protein n=1 Tax=Moorena producens TaxID=1155739 RepID=UPI003C716934
MGSSHCLDAKREWGKPPVPCSLFPVPCSQIQHLLAITHYLSQDFLKKFHSD